jgi:hypothetical protein
VAKKSKEAFTLTKVIDPHYSSMPEDIKRCFLDGIQEQREPNNDTFIWWTVGDYQHVADIDEDEYECGDEDLKKVDDWMLENGLTKGERVMLLYWW